MRNLATYSLRHKTLKFGSTTTRVRNYTRVKKMLVSLRHRNKIDLGLKLDFSYKGDKF